MITNPSARAPITETKRNQRRILRDSRSRRRRMFLETLEARSMLATITAGAGPGGFESFSTASSLALWLDASDPLGTGVIPANGSTVSTWVDKSGFGRNATATTGTPTYVVSDAAANNMGAIGFTAANGVDLLTTAYDFDALGANYTIFAVSRYNGPGHQRVITSVTRNWLFGHHFPHTEGYYFEGGPFQRGPNDENARIYTALVGPDADGVPGGATMIDFWANGNQLDNNSTNLSATIYKPGRLSLGGGHGQNSDANISEIVIINRMLNEAERFVVLNALSAKYNLAIGLQDAYTGDDVGMGNYDSNVIGIGRLDAANQLFSAGQAGFGIETAVFPDDLDAIGAGHNVATNAFTTAGVPAGVARRFTRNWQVQVNDADNDLGATLAFDYSDAGLAIGDASTFNLLRSLDGITWTDVGATAIVSGDLIKFDLTAGQLSSALYTLGDANGPILTTTPGSSVYSIGGAAVTVDSNLTLLPGGNPPITGATVSINGFVNGNADVLALPAPVGAITGSYNNTTGVLTLSGNDTAANYQIALRSVTFAKAAYQATASRTITFSATDAAALSSTDSRGMVINASAASDPITWDGTGDGVTWTDNSNWVGNVMPDSNDVAVFANTDPGLVNVPTDVIVGSISFTNTTGIPFELDTTGGNISLTIGVISQTGTINNVIDVGLAIASPATNLNFTVSAATTLTGNGVISGTGDVNKNGAGTLIVAGNNTYSGVTNVNAGTLQVLGTLPEIPINLSNVSGGLNIADTNHVKASTFYAPDGRAPWRVSDWSGQTGTFPNATAGNLPANAMWLSNNTTGVGTWIAWDLGSAYNVGKAHVWNYNETAANWIGRGVRQFDLQYATSAPPEFGGAGTWTTVQTVDWSNNALYQGTGLASYAGFDYNFAAPFNAQYVRFNNTLNYGTADAYTGLSEVVFYTAGGAVRNPIPDGSVVTVGAAATLDLAGTSETIGGLSGGGLVTSTVADQSVLTIGGGNTNGNFSGVIQNGAGTMSLAKTGSGLQTLSGVNTYTGSTTIANGTLQVSAGPNRLPPTTLLTLGQGATGGILDLNGESQTVAGIVSASAAVNRVVNGSPIAGSLTLNVASGPHLFTGVLGGPGQDNFTLTKSGAGTQILNAVNTFTGMTTINGGVLQINSDAALGTAPVGFTPNHLAISNNATLRTTASFAMNGNRGATLGAGGGTIDVTGGLTWNSPFAGGTSLTKIGAGDLILNNNAALSVPGITNINAGRLFFAGQNALGTGVVNIGNGGTLDYLTGGALTLSNTAVNLASGGNIASRPAPLTVPNITLPTTGTIIVNQDDQNTSTVILPQNIALTGPLTIQVGGGGGNGGVAQFEGVISGSAAITKTQIGTLAFTNGGNSFSGALNVTGGTLRATANGALGTVAGATNVSAGATLDFNGVFNYSTAEQVNITGSGFGGVGAINKTGGNGILSTPIRLSANATIGSAAGSLLTINPNIDLSFYNLTFVGAGDMQINGALQAAVAPANNISNLNTLATGTYSFTADSQTFNGYVDNVAGTGWLLIGRGREGWEFDTDGQGTPSSVSTNVGVAAGFAPAALSNAIVNDLLSQVGLNNANAQYRIRRATDPAGVSAYQEARWTFTTPTFTFDFDDAVVPVTAQVFASVLPGVGGPAATNTRDSNPPFGNDATRIFTWPWAGHNNQRGFSYGSTVNLVAGPSATNFLWESAAENHEIPYTEIYVRSTTPVTVGENTVTKSGTGTVTLAGNNTHAGLTTISGGTLVVAHNNALGTNAAGTIVSGDATLAFSNNVTVTGEAVQASGAGAAGRPGAIANISGSNTLAGNVTGTGAELRIGSTADTLTISGNINMTTVPLSFDGAGNVIVSGNISQSAALPLNGVTGELEVWLDATDPHANGSAVADGALITNWQDKSGKNRDFDSVGGDPNYVASSTHGAPAINFDGNDFLRTNNTTNNPRNFIDGNGEFTLISVARYSGATRARVIGAGYNAHNWLFGFHAGSTNRNGHYDGWGSLDPAPVGNVTDTNWHLHANQMNVFSDATNPAGDWWRDGVLLTNDGRGTGDSFNNNVPDGLEVGGYNGLGEPSTAEVSELLMYNRVLSDVELAQVHAYLAAKYSLAIPVVAAPTQLITKLGSGTVTLSGNNTYAVATQVVAGTLIAGSSNALGTAAAGTTVASGATLGLVGNTTIANEAIQISGIGAAGMPGALVNISGNNTIAATASVAANDNAQQIGIGSVTDRLTIEAAVNLKFARLVTDGAGNLTINGAIGSVTPTSPSLATLNNYPSGTYTITAAGQTFPALVNNDGVNSWLLIGRGRQGWEFDTNGQGTPASVSTDVGVAAGFAPAALSDAIVNDLLGQAGINNAGAQYRISRATDPAGVSPFQEARWTFNTPTFTFNFENAGAGIPVTAQIFASILPGVGGPAATNTRDSNPPFGNDSSRIFTWPWGGHSSQRGFSYGSTVTNGSNAAGSFLWEFADEQHAIPYAEIYVRGSNQVTRDNRVIKNGTGTTTFGGANTYNGTTTINAGMLVAANNTALGTIGAETTVAIGATLGFAGNVAVVAEPVTVQAVSGNTLDSIVNVSGTNSFAGAITLVTINPTPTTTGTFTGGDVGDGLDLTGTFPYAVNMGGPVAGPVQSATFASTAALPPGFTFSAPNELPAWHAPNYGSSANDNALEVVMQSIRWNTGPVTMDLANLTVGNVYKLQLLYAESCCMRGFDVSVEGTMIAPDFAPFVTQGNNTNNTAMGAVLTHQYQALDAILNVLQAPPTPFADPNPIINGITLEDLGPVRRDLNIRSDAGSLTLASGLALDGSVLTLKGAGNLTLAGNLTQSEASQLVKVGTGTATLSGTNTYSGNTTVTGGTLAVQNGNAILDAAGPVNVGLGATLQLLSSETVSSYVGAGDMGLGTNDSTLALGNNVLTSTSGAAIANVTTATTGGIVVATAITDADDDNNIIGTGIFLQAGTGIGTAVDPLESTITNFEAATATGGVFLSNTGALNIGGVTGTLSGVDVTGASGAISLTATGSISVITQNEDILGPAAITLNAQGATSNLTSSGANPVSSIRSTGFGAAVTLSAGQDVILGLPNPAGYGDTISAGSILITAGRDFILQQDTWLDVNAAGTNTVNAGRDIILLNDGSNSRLTTQGGVISLTANRHVIANVLGAILNTIDSTQGGAAPAGANVSITATTGNISIGDGVNAGTAGNLILSAPAGSITDTNLNGLSRFVGNGLTANAATGVTLETTVATATSVTTTGAGNISLNETDALNLLVTTVANGSLAITAGGALTNAAAANVAASGNANVTAPSITLGNQAGDAVNFGTLTFSSTGAVNIQENSNLDLLGASVATGAITLQSVDLAAGSQNITIPAGASLTSSGSSILLNAGDDATLAGNLSAATTVTVNIDSGNAETAGATLLLTGLITAPGGAFFVGDTNEDTFTIAPQVNAAINVNGNDPTVAPGDVLNLELTGVVGPSLMPTGTGAGIWTFAPPRQSVVYTNIEDVNAVGVVPFHMVFDANLMPWSNTNVDDLVTLNMSGTDLVITRTGSNAVPDDDDVGPIFQGDAGNILSFTYIGSTDNDILTISDVGGMLNFQTSVPSVPNNPNLSGAAELLFQGNAGSDSLVYHFTGENAALAYAVGDGSGATGNFGEVASTSGSTTLVSFFQDVESVSTSGGGGATPGAATLIGDLNPNVIAVTALPGHSSVAAVDFAPLLALANLFSGLSVNAGAGTDSIGLESLSPAQTNPLSLNLNGEADADLLRVHSTSGNTGTVTMNGGAGNDTFQIYNSTNTVDSIFGQVIVDGSDGNVAANNDTLTIIDTGDATADNVIISAVDPLLSADYRIDGINLVAVDDVIFRNIDTLAYTGTQGDDTIDAQFVNTVPLHDLSMVTINGWLGADQFRLFTSDQAGGTTPTPSGVASGLAVISLNGDAPGNPNAGDGHDVFGETHASIVGTGANNAGLSVPDTVRAIRPSASTSISINGGRPTGPVIATGDTIGDVLNLDLSGLPSAAALVLPTASGIVAVGGFQPLNYQEIEDLNLIMNNQLVNVQMGDTFVRGTAGQDLIQFTKNVTFGSNPAATRVRVNLLVVDLLLTGKSYTVAGASNDYITLANVTQPGEIYGEGGDDYISGGMGNDFLVGGLGSDQINASGGDNVLYGDNAPVFPADPNPQDSAVGGNDVLSGLGGNDVFYGGGGDDQVSAGGGNDYLHGGEGHDILDGSTGDDRVYGGAGNDVLGGSEGHDLLSGGNGNDRLLGGTGNDVLLAGGGADDLSGGNGNDLLINGFTTGENSSFSSVASTTTFGSASYSNPGDNDAALLTLLAQWSAAGDKSGLGIVTHDGAHDELFGGTGDDDFCWESLDITSPASAPSDYNTFGMGTDERFGPM